MDFPLEGAHDGQQDQGSNTPLDDFFSTHADEIATFSQTFGADVGELATSDDAMVRSSAIKTSFGLLRNAELATKTATGVDLSLARHQFEQQTTALVEYVTAALDDPDSSVAITAIIRSVRIENHLRNGKHLAGVPDDPELAASEIRKVMLWPNLAGARLGAVQRLVNNPPEGDIQLLTAAISTIPDLDRDERLDLVLRLADNLVSDRHRLTIGWQAADALASVSLPDTELSIAQLMPNHGISSAEQGSTDREYTDDRLTALVARAMAQDSTFDAVEMGRLAAKCAFFTPDQYTLLIQHLNGGPQTDAAVAARSLVDAKRLTRRPIFEPLAPAPRSMADRVRRMFRPGE